MGVGQQVDAPTPHLSMAQSLQQHMHAHQGHEVSLPPILSSATGIPMMMARDYSQPPENVDFMDNIGISAGDFMNIVDHMGSQDFTFGIFDN